MNDADSSQRMDRIRKPAGAACCSDRVRLRIGIVTETYPPEVNGVAMTVGRLVSGMLCRAHHVLLVRPRQQPVDTREIGDGHLETALQGALPVPGYPGLQFGLPAAGMLGRRFARWRPQVLYVATEGPLGWSAVSSANRLGIPAITGFHTNFHRYSAHYGVGLLGRAVLAYLRGFHNRSACTVVATEELRRQLRSAGYRNLRLLPRGVDTDLYGPHRRSAELRASWGVQDDGLAVIYVGRLAPEKNLVQAVTAFRALQQAVPDARFVLVGDGPLRARLVREHPDFIVGGTEVGTRLAAHYASADLFLFPSLTETFGNVTLEAMASGLAVVAFDYAAARQHIGHGRNGLLAGFGRPESFTQCAIRAAGDRPLRQALGESARQSMERVSWDAIYDVFERLLAEHARMAAA
jgi:glycosyltransferase involved in cell wall biosynthesis